MRFPPLTSRNWRLKIICEGEMLNQNYQETALPLWQFEQNKIPKIFLEGFCTRYKMLYYGEIYWPRPQIDLRLFLNL